MEPANGMVAREELALTVPNGPELPTFCALTKRRFNVIPILNEEN